MSSFRKWGLFLVGFLCVVLVSRSILFSNLVISLRVIPETSPEVLVTAHHGNDNDGVIANQLDNKNTVLLEGVSKEAPLLALSLPNSGSNALLRFFQCAGLQRSLDMGFHFVNQREQVRKVRDLKEIGKCLHDNIHHHTNDNDNNQQQPLLLQGCGDFQVWLDIDVAQFRFCYYPSMDPEFWKRLVQDYPQATILQVLRNPEEWYETLSFDIKQRWPDLCRRQDNPSDNNNHPDVSFPKPNSTRNEWISFYQWHVKHLRKLSQQHSSLRYIEIAMQDDNQTTTDNNIQQTAMTLHKHLGVDPQCWLQQQQHGLFVARQWQTNNDNQNLHTNAMAMTVPPPDNRYPILVTALSKSGTTTIHDFFTCGLGGGTSIHTWTKNQTTKKQLFIGKCMEYNIQHHRPLLEECSYYKVWSDIQYLEKAKQKTGSSSSWSEGRCFFPTLEGNGGLQAFYQWYPRGTLLHVTRNAGDWFRSANRWNQLQERWSAAGDCHGFPPPRSSQATWEAFYHNHTQWIRRFAHDHPSLTFVEVTLEATNRTPIILEQMFGIPTYCWGHSNKNKKGQQVVGVP